VSWLTVKVRVGVAVLRTDQTVGSSVTNVRVVTVSGVTWTSFDRSSHGKCKCQSRSRPKWPGQSESGQPQGEKNPVTTCRVSKTLCHDRPAAVTGKQILRRAQSQGAKLENNLQNCSGASRVSSSQYHTCSALHRRSQGVQLKNPEQTPLTHRVGQLDTTDSEKETPDPCAQCFPLLSVSNNN